MAAFTPSPLEQLAWDAAQARDASLSGQRARKRRDGVVHTPPELARFVARALDDLLRNELGLARGLHDGRVRVIDPACGPGSFLASALSLDSAAGPAQCELIGIDRDRAALTHARKLAAHARREGSHVSLVHADTLRAARLPARLQAPPRVLALIGNPPWTVSAAEPSRAMQALLEDFRRDEHGERLRERKLGVLADAYVRFMRWAAELARNNPQGAALGLVTNGSFLDGPVHRGMRAALARWFDVAYLIDLGGSALLARERGGHPRDGNVFGVRPSVAISLWLRRPGPDSERRCHTRYSRVWGTKDEKLAGLADARLASLPWTDVHSTEPGARWLPRVHGRSSPYAEWPSLADCMPFHREGVQTNRDDAVIDRDPQRLLDRLRAFVAGRRTAELAAAQARLRHYDPKRARAAVAAALEADPDGTRGVALRRIAYRPFDVRWFCPVPLFCHRPRPDLLAAFEHAPFALVSVRKDRGTAAYAHFAAVTLPIDNCFLSARSSCRARAFPR
ncbi:MAG TPA: type ISP restriction/modification enzyme, partial [Polyangiales bacterium]|nr:type ISP restriction/modification enzyme [Polyangiales bacterium]